MNEEKTTDIVPSGVFAIVKAQPIETLAAMVVKAMDDDITSIRSEIPALLVEAENIVVKSDAGKEAASALINRAKAKSKEIAEKCNFYISKLDFLHKSGTKFRGEALKELDRIIFIADQKNIAWIRSENERIKKEQERIDAETRERERKEKERLAKLAEKNEAKGNTEKAEEYRERAETTFFAAPVLPGPSLNTKTAYGSRGYKPEMVPRVTNPKEVFRAIAEGGLPLTAAKINDTEIKRHCKAMGITPQEARTMGFDLVEEFSGTSRKK